MLRSIEFTTSCGRREILDERPTSDVHLDGRKIGVASIIRGLDRDVRLKEPTVAEQILLDQIQSGMPVAKAPS